MQCNQRCARNPVPALYFFKQRIGIKFLVQSPFYFSLTEILAGKDPLACSVHVPAWSGLFPTVCSFQCLDTIMSL